MAKLTGPLFGFGARKALGDSVIYTKLKGKNIAKKSFTPQNPRTPSQLQVRNTMQTVIAEWQKLGSFPKERWEIYAKSLKGKYLTGYSAFLQYNFHYYQEHKEITLFPPPERKKQPILDGLVSWWGFDEGEGTTAHDYKDENHGTIYGATWASGKIGGALSFDGENDCVSVPHSPSLDLKTSLTLAAWVYRVRAATEWIINKNHWDSSNTQYGLLVYGKEYIELWLEGTRRVSYTESILNRWAYIVVTWDGSTAKIYLDGVPKASQDYSGTLTTQPYALTLACRKTHGGIPGVFWFKGLIDEVLIYNRALTPEEIKYNYERGL